MRAKQMLKNIARWSAGVSVATALASAAVAGQVPSGTGAEYPQLIVHNGKIVTVDDHSLSSELGTIVQAMAVRDGDIVALGTNETVLNLKGPQTQVINLGGRTVLPGLVNTHDHPHDWVFR